MGLSTLWDGIDDLMSYPVGAGTPMNDALSMLAVLRIVTTTDNSWQSFMEIQVSASVRCAMGRQNSNPGLLYFSNAAGISTSTVDVTDADNWMIVCTTRSTAAATTMHKIPIGGSRSTATGGALADNLTAASGTLMIGGNSDYANIRVAALAYWNAVELTTGQLDGIATAKTTQSILDLSPTWAADKGDSFATDITAGTLDRSAIVGTADDADGPAGWVYAGAAAAPAPIAAQPVQFLTLGGNR